MKKRIMALLLVFALALALGALAAPTEDVRPTDETTVQTLKETGDTESVETSEETGDAEGAETPEETGGGTQDEEEPDRAASGTVSFATLGDTMREHYYPLLAMEENLAVLKAAGGDEKTARQMEDAENQMLLAGETLYITLAGLEAQDAALSRTIAALDRTTAEMELRHQLGQISDLQLTQVKNGRTQAASGQQTLRMNIELARMQLKAMTGVALDGTLTLGALPKVTDAQLGAMDLDADLARAREASFALYEARQARDEAEAQAAAAASQGMPAGGDAAEYGLSAGGDAARYTYENTALQFELNFRTLYARVKDCAQTLAAKRTALAAEEQSYAASALQYEQGRLSANALAEAKDKLAEAKDAAADAERELFSQYRSYEWAVEYGILNG